VIRVKFARERSTGRIIGFTVEGHALFAEAGKDIVCAGVSAVTVGTVNAAEAVVGVELSTRMNEGLLSAVVPKGLSETKEASLQLLLESMVVMLQTIEQSYGKYIKLKDHFE
jgi:uncharacterized protein YsxB (DUF464 family)